MSHSVNPPLPGSAPEMLVIVRGEWRTLAFISRPDGGVIWGFIDQLPGPEPDEREIAILDTKVAAELAHRQAQWRERAEANRRRKLFRSDGPIYRVLP